MTDIKFAFSTPQKESGWGVATDYILREASKKVKAYDLRTDKHLIRSDNTVKGRVFHTISNIKFESAMKVKGDYNAGYCFFELMPVGETNFFANCYDHIFCGSTYNQSVLAAMDIFHTSVLIQGVDMDVFRPITKPKDTMFRDKFVIFSGGKFEYRKGQDLVLAAFKALQHKYKDLCLITTWQNLWDFSFQTMKLSPHINATLNGETWVDAITGLCAKNRILPNRVWHYPLVDQRTIYNLIRNSDIGVFPNRCEGGTNLALMEYMACGKPVIASYNTGHVDILNEYNSIRLMEQKKTNLEPHPGFRAQWHEPSLDELIAKIEWAYEHRDESRTIGEAGSHSMRKFTWEKVADQIVSVMTDERLDAKTNVTQRYMFGNLLNRLGLNGEGAEIGVYKGGFSLFVVSNTPMRHLYLVDRWRHEDNYKDILNNPDDEQEAIYKNVVKMFSGMPNVTIIREDSLIAANLFRDGGLDWVHIDADHSYESCKADIETWASKVRIGGIVAGHDYADIENDKVSFGVKRAVDEYVAKHGHDLKLSLDANINPLPTWYFVKDH